MGEPKKEAEIGFGNERVKQEYFALKEGRGEEQKLFEFLNRAFDDLEKNPACGIKIPRGLWPEYYVKKFEVDNLWKYNLPDGWRLIYTIDAKEVRIFAIMLEWMDHKDYERRFRY